MNPENHAKSNRMKITILTAIILLVTGFLLAIIPDVLINRYTQLLAESDPTLKDTWRPGELIWWQAVSEVVFRPIAIILIMVDAGLLFITIWKKITLDNEGNGLQYDEIHQSPTSHAGQVTMDASELEKLRRKIWSYRRLPTRLAGYGVTSIGAAVLILSIVFSSSVLALIGLPLVFWGVILFFLKPTSYVRADLLDSSAYSLLENLRRLTSEFGLKEKCVYLPPQYSNDLSSGLVFISTKDEVYVPTSDEVEIAKDRVTFNNPSGIFLIPSGVALANLLEKELGTKFIRTDLEYLERWLPRVFIEGLEIAKDFELQIEGEIIHVFIEGSIYKDLCNRTRTPSGFCKTFGCPLCSSIACVLTRASGKPVVVNKIDFLQDGKSMDIQYRILGK